MSLSWMIPKFDSYKFRQLKKENIRYLNNLAFVNNLNDLIPLFKTVPKNYSIFLENLKNVHYRDVNNVKVLFDELYETKYKSSKINEEKQNIVIEPIPDNSTDDYESDESYEFIYD